MTDEERKLVEENIGLVGKTISYYYRSHLGDEDVYQMGCIGLIRAVTNYDKPEIQFSTYAVHTIRSEISRNFQQLGRVKRKSDIDTYSIFEKATGTESVLIYETITDGIDFTDNVLISLGLEKVLNDLTEINQQILKLYVQGYTFREMAKTFGITPQAVTHRFRSVIKPLLRRAMV